MFFCIVLEEIMSYLVPEDLISLSLTCKKLKTVTERDQLWDQACLNEFGIQILASANGSSQRYYRNGIFTWLIILYIHYYNFKKVMKSYFPSQCWRGMGIWLVFGGNNLSNVIMIQLKMKMRVSETFMEVYCKLR